MEPHGHRRSLRNVIRIKNCGHKRGAHASGRSPFVTGTFICIHSGRTPTPARPPGAGASSCERSSEPSLCASSCSPAPPGPPSRTSRARRILARGEALYVGSTRLFAGGAPCLGCHGVAGHGLARAASFGPDLSRRARVLRRRRARRHARGDRLPEHGAGLPRPRGDPGGAGRPHRLPRPGAGRGAGAARGRLPGRASRWRWARSSSPSSSLGRRGQVRAGALREGRRETAMSWIRDIVEPEVPPLGGALPAPAPARPRGALHARRELHRQLLLERPREGRDRRVGDAGARLPHDRRRPAVRAARLRARRLASPGTSTARSG